MITDHLAEAGDLHSFADSGAARDDCLFGVAVFDPDLAIKAVAIPAKLCVGDVLHIQKLKTSENGVILRDLNTFLFDGYRYEPFIGLEHFVI